MVSAVLDSVDEIKARALAAKNGDLGEYSVAVHDWVTEPYQDAWEQALENETQLLIICPPDTYKSSTIQCWIERMIGLDPDIRILWLMNAGEQTQKRVMAIQETIEGNAVYKEAFPNVVPNYEAGWTKTAFYVKRKTSRADPTLMGCGFNGPYQGLHFDIIIIDDPTNQEDVNSPTTMERQRAKLRGVILDRLVEGGRIVAIMTRWGEDDLLPTFREIGFRIVTMPVVADYPWGPTISNKRFPMERIQVLRKQKTDAIFDLTYMCNPRAVEGGVIRTFRYWHPGMLPESGTVTLMAVDPAASVRTSADFTAIGLGILELRNRRLYVTDLIAVKEEWYKVEQRILRMATGTSNLVWVGMETIGFQLSIMQKMRRESNLPLRELPYRTKKQTAAKVLGLDRDKMSRALFVEQAFSNDQLYLPGLQSATRNAAGIWSSEGPADVPLAEGISVESELRAFPFGAHDDRMDVLAFLRAMADVYVPTRPRIRLGWR